MPMHQIRYAVPDGMKVENVTISYYNIEDIPGEYNIFPAQPPIAISNDKNNVIFVEPDPEIYNSFQPFPENLFKLKFY
jgi:hypothetical protein